MENQDWISPPPPKDLTGQEIFTGTGASVSDFWRFAMSDLRMNNTRGYLAEFLVANAIGLQNVKRTEWDAYDLLLDDIRIEVKSSAYLQAWEQPRLSRISFSGLRGTRYHPRHGYDPVGRGLNAHVYVFCVQTATSHETYEPLNVNQWSFYVLKRSVLLQHGRNSIGLQAVSRLSDGPTAWANLRAEILHASKLEVIEDSPWWD